MTSPWTTAERDAAIGESQTLSTRDATKYRAVAARLNYLSQDRPDLQYATKEASRIMSNPRESDWTSLKRIGRYLVGTPRTVQVIAWQHGVTRIDAYADSDWAGDREKAKSTSGG